VATVTGSGTTTVEGANVLYTFAGSGTITF
jgi:hypothetical protein